MPKKISSRADLTTETAEKVFGWKNVHKHDGKLIGKKQDKTGALASSPRQRYGSGVR